MSTTIKLALAAALLVAVGCEKKGGGAGDDCAKVAARASEMQLAQAKKAGVTEEALKESEEPRKKMTALLETRCREDKWSDDAKKCGLTAEDPKECFQKLTPDQQQKYMDEAMALGPIGMKMDDNKAAPAVTADAAAAPVATADAGMMGASDAAPTGTSTTPVDAGAAMAEDKVGGEPGAGDLKAGSTGYAECDDVIGKIEKLMTCKAIPEEQRKQMAVMLQPMVTQMRSELSRAPKDQAIAACKMQLEMIEKQLGQFKQLGCL